MSIYTIGDLHLSFNENKPMSVFGDNWEGHEQKIKDNWIKNVKENDLVVLPGDFSWSMYLKDTYKDFEYLNSLPGKKLLLKGNHDYWWTTITSMRNYLRENKFDNIDFIYNNAYEFENYIIVGTRGWNQTDEKEDKRLLKREAIRLELSIQEGIKKYGKEKEIIVFMHYPPISNLNLKRNEMTEFTKIMKKYDIKQCYYGHLHSTSIKEAVEGEHFGINFKLVSADGLDFKLSKIK
ncbi:MAG: serine/threonine protein phosphatase [Clostridia bacterium]|nr:serine/threonine protein phosphatase [Clostridia bacterium]